MKVLQPGGFFLVNGIQKLEEVNRETGWFIWHYEDEWLCQTREMPIQKGREEISRMRQQGNERESESSKEEKEKGSTGLLQMM